MNREENIFQRLQEHYKEALTLFPEDRIVGIFLQGSQNYELDIEGSDVDTKLIVVPTLEDIIFNKPPVSTTYVRANNEHIDLKDIRLMFQTFRKQNLNFVEILFTKFKIINPIYEEFWNQLIEQNEMIARYDEYKAVKTMKGIAMEKYHAMEHKYPSKLAIIEKYGYDCKQLHHLIRVEEYLERYIAGEKYADCLISKMPEYLKAIKQNYYNLENARLQAKASIEYIIFVVDKYCDEHSQTQNPKVDELLDSAQEQIMKKAIINSLEKENDDEILCD